MGYVSTPGVVCQTLPPYTTSNPFGTIVYADGSNNPSLVTDDMSLVAPPDVSLSSATLWWRGEARPTGQVAAIAVRPNGTQTVLIDRRNTSFPSSGDPSASGPPTDTLDLAGASGLTLRSACLSDCQNDPSSSFLASYDAFRVAVSVTDAAAPAGRASGELLTDAVLKGQRSVTIDATDKGGGVYLARVVSDGQVVASSGVDDPTCRDADATNNDPFEFSTIRPCPASATTTVTLDTTKLGEDVHHDIQVQVLDAAGNVTVLADRTVGVDNQPPARRLLRPRDKALSEPSVRHRGRPAAQRRRRDVGRTTPCLPAGDAQRCASSMVRARDSAAASRARAPSARWPSPPERPCARC